MTEKTVMKKYPDDEFAKIPNSFLQDNALSGDAVKLLLNIYSRAEDWTIVKTFFRSKQLSEYKISKAFRELKDAGYIQATYYRKNGKISYIVWRASIEPEFLGTKDKQINLPVSDEIVEENVDNDNEILEVEEQLPEKQEVVQQVIETQVEIDLNLKRNNRNKKERNEKSKKERGSTSRTILHDTEQYLLAETMLNCIFIYKPNFQRSRLDSDEKKEKWLQRWARDFNILLTKDKISFDLILEVIFYIQDKEFYRVNILSPGKLRNRFDEIELDMERNQKKLVPTVEDDNPDETKKLIRIYGRKFLHDSTFTPNPQQMDKFITCRKRIGTDHKKYRLLRNDLLTYLFTALEDYWIEKGKPIQVGCIISDFTWNELLPQYIKQVGMM